MSRVVKKFVRDFRGIADTARRQTVDRPATIPPPQAPPPAGPAEQPEGQSGPQEHVEPPHRQALAIWSNAWRQRWGERANALEAAGLSWSAAERQAFDEVKAGKDRGDEPSTDPADEPPTAAANLEPAVMRPTVPKTRSIPTLSFGD